jgi:tetratricopeptide (TPR) repeat protein
MVEESLAIRRDLGDRHGIAECLNELGIVADNWQGDYVRAGSLFEEALAIYRELGDRLGIANQLNNLGQRALFDGKLPAARGLLEESRALFRELGERRIMANGPVISLGWLAQEEGRYEQARLLYAEALAIGRELHDWRGIALSLEGLAAVAVDQGQIERALRLAGVAARLRETVGAPMLAEDQSAARRLQIARAALSEAAGAAAWAEGRAMPLEQAIAEELAELVPAD